MYGDTQQLVVPHRSIQATKLSRRQMKSYIEYENRERMKKKSPFLFKKKKKKRKARIQIRWVIVIILLSGCCYYSFFIISSTNNTWSMDYWKVNDGVADALEYKSTTIIPASSHDGITTSTTMTPEEFLNTTSSQYQSMIN